MAAVARSSARERVFRRAAEPRPCEPPLCAHRGRRDAIVNKPHLSRAHIHVEARRCSISSWSSSNPPCLRTAICLMAGPPHPPSVATPARLAPLRRITSSICRRDPSRSVPQRLVPVGTTPGSPQRLALACSRPINLPTPVANGARLHRRRALGLLATPTQIRHALGPGFHGQMLVYRLGVQKALVHSV
jgi:hypothetical protein